MQTPTPETALKKQKIAILGGGVGAMTAAYALTKQPAWRERYDITVYQLGWRLGGKGACGRNAAIGERIEEHGPHVWFGFYNQAFQMLRDCYQYLKDHGLTPGSPCQECIPNAMGPLDHSSLMENVGGVWKAWHVNFPPRSGTPGDPAPGVWEQVLYAIDWLLDHEETLKQHSGKNLEEIELRGNKVALWLDQLYRRICRIVGLETPQTSALQRESLLARVRVLAANPHIRGRRARPWHHRVVARLGDRLIVFLLDRFLRQLKNAIAHLLAANDDLRHAWQILDLGVTNLRGMFADDVLTQGFESINGKDYSAWIEHHGCSEPWSPLVQGIYDTCFAFVDGETAAADPNVRPRSASMEAGTTLRGMLMMFFGYCGSYAYKMQSGMGDTIFAPIYLALQHQGVSFRFFHRVKELSVRDGAVESIDIDVQATVKPEVLAQHPDGYDPLKLVKGLPCWPNQPFFDQLVEGQTLQQNGIDPESAWSGWENIPLQLRRGEDFDQVVLGISLGALPAICKQLIAAEPRWAQMVSKVRTVQTQSFQIWLKKTSEEMGWPVDPARKEFDLMSGYVQPLDSWADMSQVLDKEDWPNTDVRSVHYIFGPMADTEPMPEPGKKSDYPARKLADAKTNALQFLQTSVRPLWPKGVGAANPQGLDWNLLVDSNNQQDAARFNSQFWRANIDPSERYVLSVAGTGRYRLEPGSSGFRNLFLAGDWTRNGVDAGCVESGALSGVLAAQAIAASLGVTPQPFLTQAQPPAAGSKPSGI
jgi:uncharacterized protein with NAD-binding domain and iron-sulfur cluster